MAKLQVEGIPEAIKARIVAIAAKEYDGNVAQYLRMTIYEDLLRRDMITRAEHELLNNFR